jgi:hypothetical protein
MQRGFVIFTIDGVDRSEAVATVQALALRVLRRADTTWVDDEATIRSAPERSPAAIGHKMLTRIGKHTGLRPEDR